MSTHPNKRIVHETLMESANKRAQANQEIINRLVKYIQTNPGIRFSQALMNLNIIEGLNGDFYLEPAELLKRMR
jgi:hypothetical protein